MGPSDVRYHSWADWLWHTGPGKKVALGYYTLTTFMLVVVSEWDALCSK